MAKQHGIFKVRGTVGGANFFKTQDGYLVRDATTLDADRIKNDPAFKRTRENGSEFASAAKAGKLFRKAFTSLLVTGSDNRIVSRLVKILVAAQKYDTTHPRGQRTVMAGNLGLLQGFECNIGAPFEATMKADFTATIDRAGGKATLAIDSFIPEALVMAPTGATHFKIVTAAAAIDFDSGVRTTDMQSTAELPWDIIPTAAISLINTLPAAGTSPLFLLAGIQFLQKEGNIYYALNTGNANALQVTKVSLN
ncbi:MAG TPA: hypothetical protein VGM41_07595 [Chitinophagaceae bacterium]|jgi:hypothetical protein